MAALSKTSCASKGASLESVSLLSSHGKSMSNSNDCSRSRVASNRTMLTSWGRGSRTRQGENNSVVHFKFFGPCVERRVNMHPVEIRHHTAVRTGLATISRSSSSSPTCHSSGTNLRLPGGRRSQSRGSQPRRYRVRSEPTTRTPYGRKRTFFATYLSSSDFKPSGAHRANSRCSRARSTACRPISERHSRGPRVSPCRGRSPNLPT